MPPTARETKGGAEFYQGKSRMQLREAYDAT